MLTILPPAIDRYEQSKEAASCDPTTSAHISAHNAAHSDNTATRDQALVTLRAVWRNRLDDAYDRASKRAAKRGKKLPPRGEYYNNWGSTYHKYGPYMYPGYLTMGIYAAGDPGALHGTWANCAQGLCGANDIPAGGCGGPGGCTSMAVSLGRPQIVFNTYTDRLIRDIGLVQVVRLVVSLTLPVSKIHDHNSDKYFSTGCAGGLGYAMGVGAGGGGGGGCGGGG